MRRVWIYDKELGKCVEVAGGKQRLDANASHGIIPDFDSPSRKELDGGYKHTITGEWVTSRTRHKELLREHNCVEVGNERPEFAGTPINNEIKERFVRDYMRGQG